MAAAQGTVKAAYEVGLTHTHPATLSLSSSDGGPPGNTPCLQEIHQEWVGLTSPTLRPAKKDSLSLRLDVLVSYHPVEQVSEEDRKWAFDLMRTCVKE